MLEADLETILDGWKIFFSFFFFLFSHLGEKRTPPTLFLVMAVVMEFSSFTEINDPGGEFPLSFLGEAGRHLKNGKRNDQFGNLVTSALASFS